MCRCGSWLALRPDRLAILPLSINGRALGAIAPQCHAQFVLFLNSPAVVAGTIDKAQSPDQQASEMPLPGVTGHVVAPRDGGSMCAARAWNRRLRDKPFEKLLSNFSRNPRP